MADILVEVGVGEGGLTCSFGYGNHIVKFGEGIGAAEEAEATPKPSRNANSASLNQICLETKILP